MLSYFALATFLTLATHWWFERRLVAASALPLTWTRALRALLLANVLFKGDTSANGGCWTTMQMSAQQESCN